MDRKNAARTNQSKDKTRDSIKYILFIHDNIFFFFFIIVYIWCRTNQNFYNFFAVYLRNDSLCQHIQLMMGILSIRYSNFNGKIQFMKKLFKCNIITNLGQRQKVSFFCFKMLVLYMFYYMGWGNFAFIRGGVKCRLMADEFIKLFCESKQSEH